MLEYTRKIHLIEELLKVEDKVILKEIETILQKSKGRKKVKVSPTQKFLLALKESVNEVVLATKGKVKLQSAKSFINEL